MQQVVCWSNPLEFTNRILRRCPDYQRRQAFQFHRCKAKEAPTSVRHLYFAVQSMLNQRNCRRIQNIDAFLSCVERALMCDVLVCADVVLLSQSALLLRDYLSHPFTYYLFGHCKQKGFRGVAKCEVV